MFTSITSLLDAFPEIVMTSPTLGDAGDNSQLVTLADAGAIKIPATAQNRIIIKRVFLWNSDFKINPPFNVYRDFYADISSYIVKWYFLKSFLHNFFD
jgi:hypothetical protein